MRYLPVALTLALLAAGTAHASEQSALKSAAAAVRAEPDGLEGKQVRGRSAAAWGLNWSAANLLEKAVAERATPEARFNLATAYLRTGRFEAAMALYQELVVDGQYTEGQLDPNYLADGERSRTVNIADESARRLALFGRSNARRGFATSAPFTAAEAGVNAAAIEGVATISDEQAIALDAGAVAARNP